VIRESGNEIAKAIDTKMDLYRLAAPMRNAVHSGESEIAEPVEMGGIKIGDSLESFKKRFGQPSKTGQAEAVLVGQDWPGAAFASYSFSEVVVIVGSDGMIKHYYVGTKAE
jgi:hypothetical protein